MKVFIGKACMKTYKYSTKERAERVSKTLGCSGSHYHNEDGDRKYMPCKSHDIFLSKTKKNKKGEEQEVTELVDADGTWLSSNTPILDPASTGVGTKTMDQIVPASRNPRDPLLRGWYGYYGEGRVKENNMIKAYGYKATMDMDAKETLDYFKDELEMDDESAEHRVEDEFGKSPERDKKSKFKNKKGFAGRPILKEKESEDIAEDVLVDKETNDQENIKKRVLDINPLLVRNIKSIKKMAKENGITVRELIMMLKDEQ
jgi:hypothetical protein